VAKLTRPKQVSRRYGPRPGLSPQATPGDPDFVSPFQSSNDILGFPEAADSNRPADWEPEDEG
jgi:hypothetical protein